MPRTRGYTWASLARATLRRQFPRIRGRDSQAVVELVRRVGPIQSQVPRAVFACAAARLAGVGYDAVSEAYESLGLIRGSNLRGTVHTCVAEQHGILDAITRRTLENSWRRNLRLGRVTVEQARAEIERFATGAWRTPDELRDRLSQWLADNDGPEAASAAGREVGRNLAHGHSALMRRPLRGGWDRRTAPGYRVAAEVLGLLGVRGVGGVSGVRGVRGDSLVGDPDRALVELTRIHLGAFGPATRADVAWWTGDGLRRVDSAIASLSHADELTVRPGPGGLMYYDLADPPKSGPADPGVRLLPEFDALLLGYAPGGRDRFLDPGHLPYFWATANGVFAPVVLAGGRLAGAWRLAGSGGASELVVRSFPGNALAEDDLADPSAALATALGIEVDRIRFEPVGDS